MEYNPTSNWDSYTNNGLDTRIDNSFGSNSWAALVLVPVTCRSQGAQQGDGRSNLGGVSVADQT